MTQNITDITEDKLKIKDRDVCISIVVPVFNEERGISAVINELKEVKDNLDSAIEIIAVDDCSYDQTTEILQDIEGVKYIRHSQNLGYGGAIKTGIKNAMGDIIVITDGDGTYPNRMIPELLKEMDQHDMVVGARAINDPNVSLVRKPAKYLLGKLANYLAETKIPDLNSGLRAFRRIEVLKFFKILPSGFSFTTTITLAMQCNGYSIKYLPIEYNKRRGKSKIRPIKDTLNFIQLIFRTIMYFNPLKVFLPLVVVLFLGFILSSIYDVFILNNFTDKTIILFLACVQVFIIGLLADLIDKRI